MKKTFFTLIISMYCTLSFGQQGMGTKDIYSHTSEIVRKVDNDSENQVKMRKSKLNFFLNQEWQGGVMYKKDSVVQNNYLYRYNIYTDQIEYRTVVDNNSISVVSIGSNKFICSEYYSEDSFLMKGYFELLVNGDCKLLLRRQMKFVEGRDDIDAYGASSSTNISESIFIKKGNNPAVLIEKSKEGLKEVFSDKKQVVDYIDNRLIILMTERKIKEIVDYYNKI